ncbi:MAG: hypothetical protein OEM82_01715 [Acidobacteriota bacterium]|nr:hypothetical protein [Acidobacteriota bacterium]MDH3530337.1 hypothetical protein [Acidobacteriota bacterium]
MEKIIIGNAFPLLYTDVSPELTVARGAQMEEFIRKGLEEQKQVRLMKRKRIWKRL